MQVPRRRAGDQPLKAECPRAPEPRPQPVSKFMNPPAPTSHALRRQAALSPARLQGGPPGIRETGAAKPGKAPQPSPEPKVQGLHCRGTRVRATPPSRDPKAASGARQVCGQRAERSGPGHCPWRGPPGPGPAVGAGASPILRARAPSPAHASTFITWIIRARWVGGGAEEGPCGGAGRKSGLGLQGKWTWLC